MELNEVIAREGKDGYELTAGEPLKIEVGSETALNETVPEDESWVVSVEVHIIANKVR